MKAFQLSSLFVFLTFARANPIGGGPLVNPPPPYKIDGLYGDSSVHDPDCSQLQRMSKDTDWLVVALCAVSGLKGDNDTPNIKSFITEIKPDPPGKTVTKAEFIVHDDEGKVLKGTIEAKDAMKFKPNPAKKDKNRKAAWWSAGFASLISQQQTLKQGVDKGKLAKADFHYGLQLLTGRQFFRVTANEETHDAFEKFAAAVDKEPLLIKVKDDKDFKPKLLAAGELYAVRGYKGDKITLWNSAKSEEKQYSLKDCYDDIGMFAQLYKLPEPLATRTGSPSSETRQSVSSETPVSLPDPSPANSRAPGESQLPPPPPPPAPSGHP